MIPRSGTVGKIGTIKITYRKGHRGPKAVDAVPETQYQILKVLTAVYGEDYDEINELCRHPDESMRKTAHRLALSHAEREPSEYEITSYTIKGILEKRAVKPRYVTLEPDHIEKVEFTNPRIVTY